MKTVATGKMRNLLFKTHHRVNLIFTMTIGDIFCDNEGKNEQRLLIVVRKKHVFGPQDRKMTSKTQQVDLKRLQVIDVGRC